MKKSHSTFEACSHGDFVCELTDCRSARFRIRSSRCRNKHVKNCSVAIMTRHHLYLTQSNGKALTLEESIYEGATERFSYQNVMLCTVRRVTVLCDPGHLRRWQSQKDKTGAKKFTEFYAVSSVFRPFGCRLRSKCFGYSPVVSIDIRDRPRAGFFSLRHPHLPPGGTCFLGGKGRKRRKR